MISQKVVIASGAKQSPRYNQLIPGDCFVASLLAITAFKTFCETSNH